MNENKKQPHLKEAFQYRGRCHSTPANRKPQGKEKIRNQDGQVITTAVDKSQSRALPFSCLVFEGAAPS